MAYISDAPNQDNCTGGPARVSHKASVNRGVFELEGFALLQRPKLLKRLAFGTIVGG